MRLVDIKCNCGRRGRYMDAKTHQMSCNKYAMCPTYEVLEKNSGELLKDMLVILAAFNVQLNYKTHTKQSSDAIGVYETLYDKYGR